MDRFLSGTSRAHLVQLGRVNVEGQLGVVDRAYIPAGKQQQQPHVPRPALSLSPSYLHE